MWSVGRAVVKMKRSIISHAMTTYQNSKFPLGGRDRFEPRRCRGGVFLCPCVALAASLVSVIQQRRMCRYVGSHSYCRGGLCALSSTA